MTLTTRVMVIVVLSIASSVVPVAHSQTIYLGDSDVWSGEYTYTFFPVDPGTGMQVAVTCRISETLEYRNIELDANSASPGISFEIWGSSTAISGDPLCPPSRPLAGSPFTVANVTVTESGVTGSNSSGSLTLDWQFSPDRTTVTGNITSQGIVSDDVGQIVYTNDVLLVGVASWRVSGIVTSVDTSGGFLFEFDGEVTVGMPFTFVLTFDPSSALTSTTAGASGSRYRYFDALHSIEAEVGEERLRREMEGADSIDIWDDYVPLGLPNPAADGFVMFAGVTPSQMGGFAQVAMILRGPEFPAMFNGPGLPTVPPAQLTSFSTNVFQIIDQTDSIVGVIQSVTVAAIAGPVGPRVIRATPIEPSPPNAQFGNFSILFDDDGDGYLQHEEITSFSGVSATVSPAPPQPLPASLYYTGVEYVPAIAGIVSASGTLNPNNPCTPCWEFSPGQAAANGDPSDGWFTNRWFYSVRRLQQSNILWRNSLTLQHALWLMDSSSLEENAGLGAISADWEIVGRNDHNGDGQDDILWRNQINGQNALWLMNDGERVANLALPSAPNTDWKIVGDADYGGDNNADILWRNTVTGDMAVWRMTVTRLIENLSLPRVANLNWTVVATHDFDGDNSSDILWRNIQTGEVAIWLVRNSTVKANLFVARVANLDWTIASVNDYDGDFAPDLLWRNLASGNNALWVMDVATIESNLSVPRVANLDWEVVGSYDYNVDGKADVLWRNFLTGQNAIWLMNGGSLLSNLGVTGVTGPGWGPVYFPGYGALKN